MARASFRRTTLGVLLIVCGCGRINYDPLSRADAAIDMRGMDMSGPTVPGATVTPSSGLVTSEAGTSATFVVVLTTQPTADVTIGISSGDLGEGAATPATLTFTSTNWNVPHTVAVTGVDDDVRDGNQAYTVVTSVTASTDSNYDSLEVDDVTLTNLDDETPGFTLSRTSGLATSESGEVDTFTIRLNTMPTSDVVIALSSGDTSEGSVLPAALTFTSVNYRAAQTVTVTGVDDAERDGDVAFDVVTAAATSSDTDYGAMNPPDVSVTNRDNETPGVVVGPTDGLVTSETGSTATFSVWLQSLPTADVTIAITTGDPSEGTVAPASLTFTSANWNAPHVVMVTGVDDALVDGDQIYVVATELSASADPDYVGIDAADVVLTNVDNESAGATLSRASGLITTEGGGSDSFTVYLNTAPTDDVTIALSSSNTDEAHVTPSSLTFTALNYASPQTVTVTGVDDAVRDGDATFSVITSAATSGDSEYEGLDISDVTGTNRDDETPGIIASPTTGLVTSESGGSAVFRVVLQSQPSADVTVPVYSLDLSEGDASPTSLTFTSANWNSIQTVTVTGVDDAIADGDQPYDVRVAGSTSSDSDYVGLFATNVTLVNTDDESADFELTQINDFETSETGTTSGFQLVLRLAPTADVVLALESSDTTEGVVSAATVTFTPTNWDTPQILNVTGIDDFLLDGDQPYRMTVSVDSSADARYAALASKYFDYTNHDDDSPNVIVTPTTGLITSEAGATDTFTIVLSTQPTDDVTINLESDNSFEGTAMPGTVVFTPANWNTPQTITCTGVDDASVDGNQMFAVMIDPCVSSDPDYNEFDPPEVTVTNLDDDVAPGAIVVDRLSGLVTTEAGGMETIAITLSRAPAAAVSVILDCRFNPNECAANPARLTFTSGNWNVPQSVAIVGVDEPFDDGDKPIEVTLESFSADLSFQGASASVTGTNLDDDMQGFRLLDSPSPVVTSEAGGQAILRLGLVGLNPIGMHISLTTNLPSEVTVSPATLAENAFVGYAGGFANPFGWAEIILTGVNDALSDGDRAVNLIVHVTDVGSTVPDFIIPVTNMDDEAKRIAAVSERYSGGISGEREQTILRTTEAGRVHSIRFVLLRPPTAAVTIPLSSSSPLEASVSPASLTFTPGDWNSPQDVTVTGVDDVIVDGDQTYTIVTGPAVSMDLGYAGQDAVDYFGINTDDDDAECASCTSEYHPTVVPYLPYMQSVSSDGRYILFSPFYELLPEDMNGFRDLYVYDRVSRTRVRASVGVGAVEPNVEVMEGAISSNGRFVCFETRATNLVGGDTNTASDIFLRDLNLNTTTRVSVSSGGAQLDGDSTGCSVSNDGRYVTFTSLATNAVSGDTNGVEDAFLRDTNLGTTTRVSVTSAGVEGAMPSYVRNATDDGRYVLFGSGEPFVAADTNGFSDVYLRDTSLGVTRCLTRNATGADSPNGSSNAIRISPDGAWVWLSSDATDLLAPPGSPSGLLVGYRLQVASGNVEAFTLGIGGGWLNSTLYTGVGAGSADGRYSIYWTSASNVVVRDRNNATDAFVFDHSTHTITRVSHARDGGQTDGGCTVAEVSDDGHTVALLTGASNSSNFGRFQGELRVQSFP